MLTPSLLTKPFSKLVRRHAALVYSFNFFSILATYCYKTPCYKLFYIRNKYFINRSIYISNSFNDIKRSNFQQKRCCLMWCPKFRLRIELEIITYLKTNGEVENGLLSRFPSAGGIHRVWNFCFTLTSACKV